MDKVTKGILYYNISISSTEKIKEQRTGLKGDNSRRFNRGVINLKPIVIKFDDFDHLIEYLYR